MREMQSEDIPAFVYEVINTGCEMCAIGQEYYCVGDVDLPPSKRNAIEPVLREITERFGERDHLRRAINAYLRSIGRYVELPQR